MNYEDLIKIVLPIIYFHSNEAYFPEDLNFYIENSALMQNEKEIMNKVNINELENYSDTSSFVLKNDLKDGSLDRATLYVRVQELETQIRFAFFVFFSFNGALNVAGCFKAGDHRADMERFSFYLNKNSHEIEKIYLGAHGSKDGMWLVPNDFEKQDGKIVLYCALGSHAFYNEAKTYWRYLGLANDKTNKGTMWLNQKFVIMTIDYPKWQNFQGNLGYPDNCNVPRYRGWENEPEYSTSVLKRFFGCC